MDNKVSVAIGTWNRFEMVCQAIDAALDQTYPVHEIVVYDDCSPDNSYIRLKDKYANDPRVKVFAQPLNTGGVPNWNAAINACEGDYIAWCSDDDRFFNDHIENSIKFLEENPAIELVHSDFANVYETEITKFSLDKIDHSILDQTDFKTLRFEKPFYIDSKNIFNYYLKYFNWPFHPSTLVFTKNLWNSVDNFNPKYELADSDWYLDVTKKFRIAFLPFVGVLNRRHEDNWSSRMGTSNMQKEFFDMIFEKLKDSVYYENENEKSKLINKWKTFQFTFLLRIFVAKKRRGDLIEAERIKLLIENNFKNSRIKLIIMKSLSFLLGSFVKSSKLANNN